MDIDTGIPRSAPGAKANCRDARIVFQPIIDLTSWSVVGVEALARFVDGTPPAVRLDEAERTGDRAHLELALIGVAITAAELLPEDLFITMNASGATLLYDDLGELLSAVPRRWGIELYEEATPVNLSEIRRRVSGLGGELFVDDAGSGSADGARIRALCPDVVKIDRELFSQLHTGTQPHTDSQPHKQLTSLVAAAHATDARLLVEGVERADQVDLARELGADLAQGFYLGTPTRPENVQEMFRELHRSIGMNAPGL